MVNTAGTIDIDQIAKSLGRDGTAKFERRMPGHSNQFAKKPEPTQEKPILDSSFGLFLLKLSLFCVTVAGVLYLTAIYLGSEIALGGNSDKTKPHQIVIGNDALSVPENMIRFKGQRYSGDMARLELFVHWPSMEGYKNELTTQFNNEDKSNSILFLSLEPREMSIDMAGRIEPIYSKFFEGPGIDYGKTLIRQPLSPASGYIDEDLYYEKNSPYPFTARCVRENSAAGSSFCLRDIHLGKDMMLTYRFHLKYIDDWMMLDTAVRNRMNALLLR